MAPRSNSKADLPYRPCVGVMLTNGAGQVFVAERIDAPGAWQMPQGGIDKGEGPREAALRELEEEIGVTPEQVVVEAEHPDWLRYDLPDHLIGKVWKGRYRGQEQRWFRLRLTAPDTAITLDVDHPEFSAWKWVDPAEVPRLIVPFKRAIYDAVITTLAP